MRNLLIAASLAVLCTAPALAGDDVMAIFYGNTMVSTGGVLTDVRTHYRADHTFDIVVSFAITSVTFKGTWTADGKGNICLTFIGNAPPGAPNPQCSSIVPHKVGDTWKSKDGTRTITLAAGIQ